MEFDRLRIKSNARIFYRNNTGAAIAMPLVYIGSSILMVIASYFFFIIIGSIGAIIFWGSIAGGPFGALYMLIAGGLFFASCWVFPMLLAVGMIGWYRNSIYMKTSVSGIFAFFRKKWLLSSVGMIFLVQIRIILSSLILVIPGIIVAYSYSQAIFIKTENAGIPASRAIELSRLMMEGNKLDLFLLHLSFAGWFILTAATGGILGIVYVFPYFNAALAFAYEEIKADAAARGVIDISEITGDMGQY